MCKSYLVRCSGTSDTEKWDVGNWSWFLRTAGFSTAEWITHFEDDEVVILKRRRRVVVGIELR